MANNNRRITEFPYVSSSELSDGDILLVVSDGVTSQTDVGGFRSYLGSVDTYTTGSTLIGNTLYFNTNDTLSAYTVDLSSLDLKDTYLTGGTYDNTTNQITFTNNYGGTFDVDFSTSELNDTYITGGTLSNGTTLVISNNDGVNINVDLSKLITTGNTIAYVGDQQYTPLVVTGDGQFTGIVLTDDPVPNSRVDVIVNGVIYNVGDGVKTSDFYFSDDLGVTAKNLSELVSGDRLYFNGLITGLINLDEKDKININFETFLK